MAVVDIFWRNIKNISFSYDRVKKVKKLNNRKALNWFALNDKSENVRQAAPEKLEDIYILKKIAVTDEDIYVRKAAVKPRMMRFGN